LRTYLNPNNLETVQYETTDKQPVVNVKGQDRTSTSLAILPQPVLRTDGPYGSASEHVFEYDVVMLIGAGTSLHLLSC
jgi:hypothetical protein